MVKDRAGYPEADKVMKNGILIACHQTTKDDKAYT